MGDMLKSCGSSDSCLSLVTSDCTNDHSGVLDPPFYSMCPQDLDDPPIFRMLSVVMPRQAIDFQGIL